MLSFTRFTITACNRQPSDNNKSPQAGRGNLPQAVSLSFVAAFEQNVAFWPVQQLVSLAANHAGSTCNV